MHPRAPAHRTPRPEALSTYSSREELRPDYPELDEEDIRQAIAYAAAMMGEEIVEMKAAS